MTVYGEIYFFDDGLISTNQLILSIPPHTILITNGDFDVRIGGDSHESNRRIGPHCSYEETIKNDQILIILWEVSDLRPAHSPFFRSSLRHHTYVDSNGHVCSITTRVISGDSTETRLFNSLNHPCTALNCKCPIPACTFLTLILINVE